MFGKAISHSNGASFDFNFMIYKKTQLLRVKRKGKENKERKKSKGKDLQEKNVSFLFCIMLSSFSYWFLEMRVPSSQNVWIQSWMQYEGFFSAFILALFLKKNKESLWF